MVSGRLPYFSVQVLSNSILGFEKQHQVRSTYSLDILPKNHPAALSMCRITHARNRYQVAAHQVGLPFFT